MHIRPHLPFGFPKIVCLCGSTRFSDAFKEANLKETIAGNIVLSIGCDTKSDKDLIALGELTQEAKDKLDELHKRKIDLCDEIFVLNIGGYIGDSTRSEIIYANSLGKRIRYLEHMCCESMTNLQKLSVGLYCSNPDNNDDELKIYYDFNNTLKVEESGVGEKRTDFVFKFCPFCGKQLI